MSHGQTAQVQSKGLTMRTPNAISSSSIGTMQEKKKITASLVHRKIMAWPKIEEGITGSHCMKFFVSFGGVHL